MTSEQWLLIHSISLLVQSLGLLIVTFNWYRSAKIQSEAWLAMRNQFWELFHLIKRLNKDLPDSPHRENKKRGDTIDE